MEMEFLAPADGAQEGNADSQEEGASSGATPRSSRGSDVRTKLLRDLIIQNVSNNAKLTRLITQGIRAMERDGKSISLPCSKNSSCSRQQPTKTLSLKSPANSTRIFLKLQRCRHNYSLSSVYPRGMEHRWWTQPCQWKSTACPSSVEARTAKIPTVCHCSTQSQPKSSAIIVIQQSFYVLSTLMVTI